MSRTRLIAFALTLACAVGIAAPAFAQAQPPQGRAGGGQRPAGPPDVTPNMTVNEMERLFDEWEIDRARAPLQLDQRAFITFVPRFKQLLFVQRQHQGARQRLIGELANLLKAEAATDDVALAAKTKAIDELEAQQLQDVEKALGAVDQLLTVKQRARLRVFMHNMERQKLDLIAQVRQQAIKGTPGATIIK